MNELCVIVDIDGTISSKEDRGWYEYSRVMEDFPIERLVRLVKMLHANGINLVFCTGREDSCMKQSIEWIKKHIFMNSDAPVEIYMRKTGDRRPDYVVKKEMYINQIEPRHKVWFVLDDRNSVVKMWREIGLTCLQVAEGDY
jgi:hydroxymethylpyrimidine pyrophosphatase-like HAD family hydrolase